MTNPFMYSPGLSPNGQGNGDDSSTSSPFPPSQPGGGSGTRRRSSYASVAAASRVRAASQRAAAAGVSVSYLLNPSSPGGDSRTSPTDHYYSPSSFEPAASSSDTMHRGHFYSSVGDYERNMLARGNDSAARERRTSSSLHLRDEADMELWQPQKAGGGGGGGGGGGLAWHSRAYDFLLTPDSWLHDEVSADGHYTRGTKFLRPSYLKGTVYMTKLEEQYRRRLEAYQEQGRGLPGHIHGGIHNNGGASFGGSSLHSVKHNHPPASHRGITLDVVEKAPKFMTGEDNEEDLSPLPSRWNRDDKHGALDVVGEGYDVKYIGPKSSSEKDHEACAIRADHYMPGRCGVYYFEVTVMARKHADTTVVIGFSSKQVSLSRAPGWEPDSWGYHGDDGHVFAAQSVGKAYGPKYGLRDTVGCLVNFRTGTVNFTRNGVDHGIAFRDNSIREGKREFYPTIGLKKPGDHVSANFGQNPFVFDIDGYVKMEKQKIWEKIRQADTSNLVPGLSETELIQQLVLQHLQHDGYVETARAFAEEIVQEKEHLRLDDSEPVPQINVKDDEDARQRQQIRKAILDGNIDLALEHTNTHYPNVLESSPQVYFRLRCRKFIEMIRDDAEQQNSNRDKTSSSSSPTSHPPPVSNPTPASQSQSSSSFDSEMELDDEPEPMEETETEIDERAAPVVGHLLQQALEYGQQLRKEFASSTSEEEDVRRGRELDDIFVLMAYDNPLKVGKVRGLLDKSGRMAVAEELNSAILLSLGKSSRSALETMYAQTVVLLDELREDGGGGDGALVAIQDIMDRVTAP